MTVSHDSNGNIAKEFAFILVFITGHTRPCNNVPCSDDESEAASKIDSPFKILFGIAETVMDAMFSDCCGAIGICFNS
jgi:hypothetical protein